MIKNGACGVESGFGLKLGHTFCHFGLLLGMVLRSSLELGVFQGTATLYEFISSKINGRKRSNPKNIFHNAVNIYCFRHVLQKPDTRADRFKYKDRCIMWASLCSM